MPLPLKCRVIFFVPENYYPNLVTVTKVRWYIWTVEIPGVMMKLAYDLLVMCISDNACHESQIKLLTVKHMEWENETRAPAPGRATCIYIELKNLKKIIMNCWLIESQFCEQNYKKNALFCLLSTLLWH